MGRQQHIESDETFPLLFRAYPQPMMIYDRQTLEILEVNDATEHVSGYSRDELLSMTLRDVWPSEEVEKQTALVRGERPSFRHSRGWKFKRKDGKIVDAEVNSHILDFNGHHATVAVAYDITELVATGRALRQYQALADNTRDMIFFVRLSDMRIVEANAAALSEYGYTREEMLSMDIDGIRPPGERRWTPEQLTLASTSGLMFEDVHRRKDGTIFPVEVGSRVIDIDGIQTVISVARSIEARKVAERKLERQERILRLFVENSPAAAAMFDCDMRYIVASRRYLSDYRLGEIDLVGRSHYDVFPEMPERWKEIHRKCLTGKIEKCDEDAFARADGTIDWVKWEIRPWYEDAGQIGGIILFSEVINEQKRVAEELEMSRLRLLGLINSAMDGIISLDENQKIILFNPASEKMFGVTAEEMIGKTLDELIPEPYRDLHANQILRFGRSGKTDKSRHMMRMRIIYGLRSNGETFPMEASISQIEVGGRKIYTVIHHDVTDQLKAREELRQSEENYRTLYENSSVGIYRTTPDGRILMSNPALVKLLGYSSFEELANRNLEVTGFEPSYPRSEFVSEIEEKGEIKGLESSWIKKDGTPIFVRENARAIRDVDGKTLYYDGVVEDISERKEAEDKISRLNRVYAVLSGINQAIVRIRDKQKLFEEACRIAVEVGNFKLAWIGIVNEEEQSLKIAAKAGSALEFLDLIYISFTGKDSIGRGPMGAQLRKGYPVVRNDIEHDDIMLPWKADSLKFGIGSAATFPFMGEDRLYGGITFYSSEVGLFDPQEVLLLQELSSDIVYAMENLDRDEQRKSLQTQLVQAQKMESLGTLAGGIAHDFNNILGIIMGYTAFLDAKELPRDRIEKSVNAIKKATDRGAALVKQLLTFARKEESIYETVQINEVVNESARLLKETLPKTVNLVTNLADNVPTIAADVTQLHQVILNLCVNARDAMPDGGVITMTTHLDDGEKFSSRSPEPGGGQYVVLGVGDTGIGMDGETKRRIFDPFFTTKGVGKGTGLGLALVHSIVTNHNGRIEVESQPGRGTTFQIFLPVKNEKSVSTPHKTPSMEDVRGGTETILVIEDEQMLMELVKVVLTSKGYQVISARDGDQGIEAFRKNIGEIGAVISDIGLPRVSGAEVLRQIRAIDSSAKLIAASGFIEPEVKSKLMEIGVTSFVHKPYATSEILRTLRDLLDAGK